MSRPFKRTLADRPIREPHRTQYGHDGERTARMMATSAAVDIDVTGMTDNANGRLLQGFSTIQGSFMSGSADEQITQALGAGTYVIRVYGVSTAETPYTLSVQAA